MQPRLKRTNSWNQNTVTKHMSMWSKNYQLKEIKENKSKSPKKFSPKKEKQLPTRTPTTRGKVTVMKTDSLKNQLTPKKRTHEGKFLYICFSTFFNYIYFFIL